MIDTVAHFLDSDTFGGCEEVVLSLLAGLDRNRWQPILFHYDAPGITRLLNEVNQLGISCRVVPRMTGKNKTNTLIQFCRQLSAAKPTVFHAHLNWPLACRYGLMAAKLSRVPAIVATSHLYFPVPVERFGRLKQHLQASLIDRYIAVSNEVKKRLCNDLGITELKVRVVHNGIQLAPFDVPTDSNLRGLLVGWEDPRYNGPFASYRAELEHIIAQEGLGDKLIIADARPEAPQLVAAADMVVMPSVEDAWNLAVTEAMASAKPVIGSKSGGIPEQIVDGVTGFLVQLKSPEALAEKLAALAKDPKLRADMGKAARQRAESLFDETLLAQKFAPVYEALVKGYKNT